MPKGYAGLNKLEIVINGTVVETFNYHDVDDCLKLRTKIKKIIEIINENL